MRLLAALCVTAVVVAFAVPAFAETQNVKLSGDIGVSSVYQSSIDFNADDSGNTNIFMQQVGLNVEADLTDNVSTYVRIINEREWDAEEATERQFDVSLDEAYVTLKEMLYAPLTLKIGRQNIWLGKGFVIGNAGAYVWDSANNLATSIHELSDMTAFDAIRATLDYDPWTIDLIYAKIDENATPTVSDDVDLYVANVGYDFTKYDAEAEGYLIVKWDRQNIRTTEIIDTDEVWCLGIRGSLVPFDNMYVWAEGAYQIGEYRGNTTQEGDRDAQAVDIGGEYTFVDVRWTPKIGGEYTYLSGEEAGQGGDWQAWEPLYTGKFDTYIADFLEITKVTDRAAQIAGNDSGATNLQKFAVIGALNPMTDVTVDARWTIEWYDEVPIAGKSDEKLHELDAKLTYDYTEDVQFAVAAGIVWPLDYYPAEYDSTASQIISAVTVEF